MHPSNIVLTLPTNFHKFYQKYALNIKDNVRLNKESLYGAATK